MNRLTVAGGELNVGQLVREHFGAEAVLSVTTIDQLPTQSA